MREDTRMNTPDDSHALAAHEARRSLEEAL